MRIVRIEMLRDFEGDRWNISYHLHESHDRKKYHFEKGRVYYAIDGGEYWLVQEADGYNFDIVICKKSKKGRKVAIERSKL